MTSQPIFRTPDHHRELAEEIVDLMAPATLTIPGPQNDNIVGILEQKLPNPSPGTKIIVILHGHAYSF